MAAVQVEIGRKHNFHNHLRKASVGRAGCFAKSPGQEWTSPKNMAEFFPDQPALPTLAQHKLLPGNNLRSETTYTGTSPATCPGSQSGGMIPILLNIVAVCPGFPLRPRQTQPGTPFFLV